MSMALVSLEDVRRAAERIRPELSPTPLRHYPPLDDAVGRGVRVLVKHENHLPTNAFKARNALSALSSLSPGAGRRGVVAATRGNHGQGLAWAGARLGIPVTICVPEGNNPEKNEAMVGYGAELVVSGRDYDDAVAVADRLVGERGLTLVHSTVHSDIVAGAGTISLEIAEETEGAIDAAVVAVGGGSQAVGALAVFAELCPHVEVYAVQAAGAPAVHDSYWAGSVKSAPAADTFADGLATRSCYEPTLGALRRGLAGFTTVTDAEIASALRLYLRATHNLAEGAAAAGLAGARKLAPELAGKTVAIILSGANIDQETLRRVVTRDL